MPQSPQPPSPATDRPISTPHDPALRETPIVPAQPGLFAEPARTERRFPTVAVVAAAVAVLFLLALALFFSRKHAGTPGQTAAGATPSASAYALQLQVSGNALSESTSFSGGKETFVDGRITNTGPETVTGVTLQVAFPNDAGIDPQREIVPLTLIRSRQPYIDTEPVSAAPLAPGANAEFRLTFDDIRPDWNQQPPELRIIGVNTR